MVCKKYVNEDGKTVSAKMSKSIGNIVEPQTYIDQYGSDALQMFMIFAAPPSQNFDFEDDGIVGSYRFLDSVYRYFTGDDTTPKTETVDTAKKAVNKMIQQFDKEFSGRLGLNTLVPQLMTTFKIIKKTQFEDEAAKKEIESDFVKYLSVFAPKIAYYIQNRK
jgi:leucyl-tRNA synthetase